MEAKVDVRKLQLLNDRIIQTLEALNQVRASVHGIGQSPYPMGPTAPIGLGHSSFPYGMYPASPQHYAYPQPWQSIGLAHTPYPMHSTMTPVPTPIGLSHTPYGPQMTPWQSQMTPWQSQMPWQQVSPWSPYGQHSPYATNGLTHTSAYDEMERRMAEQRASDVGRMLQSFPYGAYV